MNRTRGRLQSDRAAEFAGIRNELEKLRLGSFRGASGSFRQRSEITPAQRAILAQLQMSAPPLLAELAPAVG